MFWVLVRFVTGFGLFALASWGVAEIYGVGCYGGGFAGGFRDIGWLFGLVGLDCDVVV